MSPDTDEARDAEYERLVTLGRTLAAEHVRSQRADYIAGHTDESDPLAPARGVLAAFAGFGLAMLGAFALGWLWPFGSWVAAGAW